MIEVGSLCEWDTVVRSEDLVDRQVEDLVEPVEFDSFVEEMDDTLSQEESCSYYIALSPQVFVGADVNSFVQVEEVDWSAHFADVHLEKVLFWKICLEEPDLGI